MTTRSLQIMAGRIVWTLFLAAVPRAAPAAHPLAEQLFQHDPEELFEVTNGALEKDGAGGLLRWRVNTGQTSHLAVRPDHPLFDRLRYYDRLDLEFRIAGGEISGFGLEALGHVSGARQYKVHQTGLAVRTTSTGAWHHRQLDLARPSWFPWDDPDGSGRGGFFRFSALAIASDTVIELRNVRLTRSLLILKPDYELPATWPIKTQSPDGSITYTLPFRVLNASGGPTTIGAEVLSDHRRFKLALEPATAEVTSARIADFTLKATMSKQDLAAVPELYEEAVRLRFAMPEVPEAACLWQSVLVRPLTGLARRQVIVAPDELKRWRAAIDSGDEKAMRLLSYHRVLKTADDFVEKKLLHVPIGHARCSNNYIGDWRAGDAMPEAVHLKTGERQLGTRLASATWQAYLANPGHACETLGEAYLYTGDEKYARKAVELLRLYARDYRELPWGGAFNPPWNRGGATLLCDSRVSTASTYGTNMFFRGHCRLASMTADSPAWTDAIRREVYEGFVVPYATELMKFPGGINNMTDITNHNVLLLGIVFDDAHLVRWATKTAAGVVSRLRDVDADGFSSEGRPLNYHLAGMAEYLPSIAFLENSRLPIPYPKQRLLAAVRMPFLRATLDGIVPNTGDCGRGQRSGRNRHAEHLVALFPRESWLDDVSGEPLRLHLAGRELDRDGWRKLLDPNPRLFPAAGMAILRSGNTSDEQVMATLDYGRNVMHAALDRNQITLCAFGKIFSHGPGSSYNVGSGGITKNDDRRLLSFISHGSLGQNVVVVDAQDQMPAIGKLLAFSAQPDYQVAVSRVDGIRPGVAHVRGLVHTAGLVVVLDRLISDEEHTYDFVYHNFGKLTLGDGWTANAHGRPLARTANYENIVDLERLSGNGPLDLRWDLTEQVTPRQRDDAERQGQTLPAAMLDFRQLRVAGGEVFTGLTGLNNPNKAAMPDEAPSVLHRVRAARAEFAAVLEPHRGRPRVERIEGSGAAVTIRLDDGQRLTVDLDDLCRRYGSGPEN
ncbi:MAG: alginate lyase family protein [Planctomycetota bacterium]|jgi:hypothetical protein